MNSTNSANEFSTLFYPFLHEPAPASAREVLAQVTVSAHQKCAEVVALRARVLDEYLDELVRCAQAMARAFGDDGKLLAFGNGGSATDAQDLAADCMLRGLPALSLTNDAGIVTAVGNDVGFENVFSRQLIALGQAGDIAFGISTSGSSRNVELAFATAHQRGMVTIGLAGHDGGKTAELLGMGIVDFCFTVPSTYVPRIQEVHATIYHTLIETASRMWAR